MMERRFRPSADGVARIPCRVCFRAVDLHPDFLVKDEHDERWVMHCPHCQASFPVRVDDSMEALLARLRASQT